MLAVRLRILQVPGTCFSKELLVEDKEFVDTTGTVVAGLTVLFRRLDVSLCSSFGA
jgi:hypothetical protein